MDILSMQRMLSCVSGALRRALAACLRFHASWRRIVEQELEVEHDNNCLGRCLAQTRVRAWRALQHHALLMYRS